MGEKKAEGVEERVVIGDRPTHDAFIREIQALLDAHGISDADRERILASAVCPCCGGSGATLVVKLDEDDASAR